MEKIEISNEQEQKLLSLFKARKSMGLTLIIIGVLGTVSGLISIFLSSVTWVANPFLLFFILGTIFRGQSIEAQKKIGEGAYEVYKAECKKVGWENASVDNNEVLSKKVKKPMKKIDILGSNKSMKAGDEIGILLVNKTFWVFPLSE